MVSSSLCPAVHILGSQNVYGRAEGIADHYWPWAVFFKILIWVSVWISLWDSSLGFFFLSLTLYLLLCFCFALILATDDELSIQFENSGKKSFFFANQHSISPLWKYFSSYIRKKRGRNRKGSANLPDNAGTRIRSRMRTTIFVIISVFVIPLWIPFDVDSGGGEEESTTRI